MNHSKQDIMQLASIVTIVLGVINPALGIGAFILCGIWYWADTRD